MNMIDYHDDTCDCPLCEPWCDMCTNERPCECDEQLIDDEPLEEDILEDEQ